MPIWKITFSSHTSLWYYLTAKLPYHFLFIILTFFDANILKKYSKMLLIYCPFGCIRLNLLCRDFVLCLCHENKYLVPYSWRVLLSSSVRSLSQSIIPSGLCLWYACPNFLNGIVRLSSDFSEVGSYPQEYDRHVRLDISNTILVFLRGQRGRPLFTFVYIYHDMVLILGFLIAIEVIERWYFAVTYPMHMWFTCHEEFFSFPVNSQTSVIIVLMFYVFFVIAPVEFG